MFTNVGTEVEPILLSPTVNPALVISESALVVVCPTMLGTPAFLGPWSFGSTILLPYQSSISPVISHSSVAILVQVQDEY